jgi:tripartite-type tricarboxylate transporter receptor subunit TctC
MSLFRRFLLSIAAALLIAGAAFAALAQSTSGYPNKLVRIIVPSPPGGPPDRV